MYIILVIVLVNFKIINGAETSDDKFINSLPEDQKRGFLEKVEERIKKEVPEVKSPEGNETNVELYEQQLEDQGKSIQKILRTEIDSLKRRSNTSGNRRSNRDANDKSHIDLTLRSKKDKRGAVIEGTEKPFKSILVKNENQEKLVTNVPVVIKYDSQSTYPKEISSKKQSKVHNHKINKTNEITWITSSTKSLNKINTIANISGNDRRINYIDTISGNFNNAATRSVDFNKSIDSVTADKVNTSTDHIGSDTGPDTVNISKEDINLSTNPNYDSTTTENIVSTTKLNVNSQTEENEEDNRTKGNILVPINDTTPSYVISQQNYADISPTTNYPYSEITVENSSLTQDNVNTEFDVEVGSTTKYDVDAYLTNAVSNETQENENSQNIDENNTQYEVDISPILDKFNTTLNFFDKISTLNDSPIAYDVYSRVTLSDDSTTIPLDNNGTLENNNLTLDSVESSANIGSSTSETTDYSKIEEAHNSISTVIDSSTRTTESIASFKNNYVTTDAQGFNSNGDLLTVTQWFINPNQPDHSTKMPNLSGSSLQGNTHTGKDDFKNNISSEKPNNIIGTTILGDVNAEPNSYHSTAANYLNVVTENLPRSTKLGNVNAPNDAFDNVSEIPTDNSVGITKLGNINPDTHEKYPSATVKNVNTVTDSPSASTILGDVSAEKYDGYHSTTPETVTDNLPRSTKLGNVNPEKNIIIDITGPIDQDIILEGGEMPYNIPSSLKMVVNIIRHNKTKKSEPNTDSTTNNTELKKSVPKTTENKDLGDLTSHLALKLEEDKNTYRVYEVDPQKKINDATKPDSLDALLKYIKDTKKETVDPKHNKDAESHPHYVRVYNYDPENAYFNVDHQIHNDNSYRIIKEVERHSKSTNLDINLSSSLNISKSSLKTKDIEDTRPSSNDKNIIDVDKLIFSNSFSDTSNDGAKAIETALSEDDTLYEKPLKRGLNKIRQILFNVENDAKEKKSNMQESNKYEKQTKVDNKYAKDQPEIETEQHETEGIENIVAQVKKLVDRAEDTDTLVAYSKKDSIDNSDGIIYKDILNSFKISEDPDIQLVIETLESIEDKKYKHENRKPKNIQSRFKIKGGGGNHLKKDLSFSKDNSYIPLIIPEDIYVKGHENEEKPNTLEDKYLEVHVKILKELVVKDDIGLVKYDWLGSTVLIQAGIEKLQHIVDTKLHHKRLHPLDHQLIKFVTDLHITAEEVIESYKEDISSQRRLSFPKPKSKKGKSHKTLQKLVNDLKKGKTRKRSGHDINDLEEFLKCLKQCLNNLHTAVKHISHVTNYRSQHWFRDLKRLYLKSAGSKEYLELLLHLTTARLIGLLDDSAKKMVAEDDDYVRKNRPNIERIGVEFITVLRICKELEGLK